MTNTQWNIGLSLLCTSPGQSETLLTMLVITFALFGLPSNILVKRFGPKKVLPCLLMAVGAVLVGAGCCSSPAAWFALRLCAYHTRGSWSQLTYSTWIVRSRHVRSFHHPPLIYQVSWVHIHLDNLVYAGSDSQSNRDILFGRSFEWCIFG